MKGYMPNLKISNKELNSQAKQSFIELGVKLPHPTDCECKECLEKHK